jgi:uncharacterized membrane protein
MTDQQTDQFEMRRLESLSNTIFGVAMTLLAYDLPKAGVFTSAPDWNDLYQVYAGKLTGLALSFIIAGVFWISHHRRLVRRPIGSRGMAAHPSAGVAPNPSAGRKSLIGRIS